MELFLLVYITAGLMCLYHYIFHEADKKQWTLLITIVPLWPLWLLVRYVIHDIVTRRH